MTAAGNITRQPILVLGGTFDPVHRGHLHIANFLAQQMAPVEIRFIPCARPPHRQQPSASAEQRLEMLQIALRDTGFIVDGQELQRRGTSWTVDTVRQLRAVSGVDVSLTLVLGYDAWQGFQNWRDSEEIRSTANLLLCPRPGFVVADLPVDNLSREQLLTSSAGQVWRIDMPVCSYSASEIRHRAAAGQSLGDRVAPAVADYIRSHQLYRQDG